MKCAERIAKIEHNYNPSDGDSKGDLLVSLPNTSCRTVKSNAFVAEAVGSPTPNPKETLTDSYTYPNIARVLTLKNCPRRQQRSQRITKRLKGIQDLISGTRCLYHIVQSKIHHTGDNL